jgi:hypothetical protein
MLIIADVRAVFKRLATGMAESDERQATGKFQWIAHDNRLLDLRFKKIVIILNL